MTTDTTTDEQRPCAADGVSDWDAQGVRLEQIVVSAGHDYWGKKGAGRLMTGYSTPGRARAVEAMGLEGDRYFGEKPGGKAQVTFIDADVIDAVRERFRLPKLPAGVLRRNLVVRGADLAARLGERFTLQGVCFEGSQECKPCHWMDRAVAPGAQAFLKQDFRGGLRARVLSTGELHVE